jgi:hypothetical protein
VAKNRKVTEEELVSRIKTEITDSLGYGDEISKQRETAMEYYYGLPFGNEVEGRSQFVDSTVADTIEWIKPSLMRVFASGDEMVKFSPHGPEDVQMAEQATDYVNYVFTKDNPGWEILYSWFTDALLSKNGIVKVWWDEYSEEQREEYNGLDDTGIQALLMNEGVEVMEHTAYEDSAGYGGEAGAEAGAVPQMLHDVVIKRTNYDGRIKIENVPPSEFLISREAKHINDARFVCHRVKKTLSELREMYPDENLGPEDLSSGEYDDVFPGERESRFNFDNSSGFTFGESEHEEALRSYWLHESFLKTDFNSDGIAELRKVCTVGDKVLQNDEIDSIPFVSITPVKIPHKFFGLSVADLVMDLQLMKSTLTRNLMDNMYNQNFGRYAVIEGQANLDDLLTQRPGGVVRVKAPGAVTRLDTPTLEPYSFEMLKYIDGVRESRAGVTKYSQGMNENALTSHTTATAVNAVMTAAQSRVELIARNFAETGVKDLMRTIYELLLKNQDKQRTIMLRNQWIPVRPDAWKDKYDCTVSVALGNGSKDQQMAHLSQMLSFAGQAMQGGLSIVTEQNMYNLGASLVKAMGFQNVSDFLTDPSQAQPKGPSPQEQMAQTELQIKKGELDVKVAETQIKQQKVQLDAAKLQADTAMKAAEIQLEAEQERPVGIG